jgi:hypothetical protein
MAMAGDGNEEGNGNFNVEGNDDGNGNKEGDINGDGNVEVMAMAMATAS